MKWMVYDICTNYEKSKYECLLEFLNSRDIQDFKIIDESDYYMKIVFRLNK